MDKQECMTRCALQLYMHSAVHLLYMTAGQHCRQDTDGHNLSLQV